MKKNVCLLCVVGLLLSILTTQAQEPFHWPYKIVDGTIITEVPARPAGQQHVLNLRTPKLPVVHAAFVGLGMRASFLPYPRCSNHGIM